MKKNQSQVQGKETTLGERPIRIYIYEALNRLIHATGKAKNASYDMAMSFGRMSEPLTKVQKVDSTTTAKSYNFAYKYEDSNHPTAPTQIGHDHYAYDANGNPTLVTNDSTNTTREMHWDEDNRLMVLSDNALPGYGYVPADTTNTEEIFWKANHRRYFYEKCKILWMAYGL